MANILHWLLPKEEKFFVMLKEHSSNMVDASKELKKFIDSYGELREEDKKDFVKKIKAIETKGDEIAHKIMGLLDKSFITPIDKEDIHGLAMLIDDVVDIIYETSVKISIFELKDVDEFIIKLTQVGVDIVGKTDELFANIGKLKHMNGLYVDVHSLENKADEILYEALSHLFKTRDPVNIIKYKEVYEFLEAISDKCEDIANVVESVVVKHA